MRSRPSARITRARAWSATGTLAAMCGLACAGRPSHAAPDITMARLRAEVDAHVCAAWSPEVQEYGGPLFAADCPRPAASTELTPAVQRALLRVRPIGMLATTAEEQFASAVRGRPESAQAAADTLAREAFWRDPQLSRAIMLAMHAELRAEHRQWADCPTTPAPTPLTIAWSTFRPYLAAYMYPQAGDDGKIEVYTCSGINGAAALPPDPRLLQAGVLTAFHFTTDEAMSRQIRGIADASRSIPDATAALHTFLDSPAGRTHACVALADLEWFTGLRIHDCPR